MIVFIRTAQYGAGRSAPIFEVRPDGDRFVGILVGGTQLVYRTAPGQTRFMLARTGRYSQFMDAELEGGKIYYAAAVFFANPGERSVLLLRPVTIADQQRPEFQNCVTQCKWVENSDKAESWAREHRTVIEATKAESLPVWEASTNRAALRPSDGR